MSNPVLNLNQLNVLRQLNPINGVSVLKKLIAIYLKSAPAFLSQIENAIHTKDSHLLRRAAHTFKSSNANIGAETLTDICQKLEDFGDNNQVDEAAKLLAKFQHESLQVTIALEEILVEYDVQK
ncbi:HPt (histidine-containing phosphotransfer) domain-containing protein [Nitrosomonas sp. Nm84]|uniref:Hpt domain-containing protein n=1 Tax=Nitrosomonas sp. Nm84 TaxID=200124 RepID=UPI000D7530C9|nr:Hpt domain-containing protein [Nitrosomonas sp. Nm84]PXW88373.1 HPt (histidine-containing phosphotransfer) domain-containing protein [Nitrosomonas sp. Nm84]